VGVAFRLACAFIGFSDVVVSLSDVGPGGRFLAGGGGRGGGRVWVEGVHGGDKAEGDGEETREDDRGGFIVVVAIKVVAIVVVLGIGIFPIIVVVAIKVLAIIVLVLAIVIIAVLVVHRLEGPNRLVACRAGNLRLDECAERRQGRVGRGERVGHVPDDPVFREVFRGGGITICGRVLLAEKAEALSERADEGGFGWTWRVVAGEGDAEQLGCLAVRPAHGRAGLGWEGHVFGGHPGVSR
jgi:hypothetical protein